MTLRLRGWMIAFAVSGLMWIGIIWGISELARVFSAEPPTCPGRVCRITGPGGVIMDWKLYVLLNALRGKSFIVPAGWCASACVLAVGTALNAGATVMISPMAVFQVHQLGLFMATPMPAWFRRVALRNGHVG